MSIERVVASHLVEVDLVEGDAVAGGLDLRQHREGGEGATPDSLGERGRLQQRADRRIRPGRAVVDDPDEGPGRPQPAAGHGLDAETPPLEAEAGEEPAHVVEPGARVEQRAEDHVAGHARGAAEPDRGAPAHRRGSSARTTAMAAPKPLSMPTTVTPAAQDESIDSSAVTPSSELP